MKEGLRTFLRVRVNLFGLPVDGDKRQQKLQRLPVPSCSNVLFVANWPVIACVPRTYNRPTATSMARQVQRLTWAVIINTYILPASASRLHAGTQQIYLKLSRLQTARKAKSITKIEIGSFSNFFLKRSDWTDVPTIILTLLLLLCRSSASPHQGVPESIFNWA